MAKGAKPGERRGGRAKGVPNKATADIKEIARQYTSQAVEKIVELMSSAESEQVSFAAAKELIDRGYGKSPQAMEHAHSGKLKIETLTDAQLGQLITRLEAAVVSGGAEEGEE